MANPSSSEIRYWNRFSNTLEVERVYGEGAVRWLYESALGRALGQAAASGPLLSRLYGALQSSRWSARKIPAFVRAFSIPMEEYQDPGFRSFNDFFIRKFRPGLRTFSAEPRELPAFCEARYLAYASVPADGALPVKGYRLSPAELLGSAEQALPFIGGPAFIARLCPVDYHRFHYPDAGRTLKSYSQAGPLHSVNPLALGARRDILITNERRISLLETRGFGRLAYVEIGATLVGKIVQTHDERAPFSRGDEKGYFLFGGSCVVLLGEPGSWRPDADLAGNSAQGLETLVRLGARIAAR